MGGSKVIVGKCVDFICFFSLGGTDFFTIRKTPKNTRWQTHIRTHSNFITPPTPISTIGELIDESSVNTTVHRSISLYTLAARQVFHVVLYMCRSVFR